MTFWENASPQVYVLSTYTNFRPRLAAAKKIFCDLALPHARGTCFGPGIVHLRYGFAYAVYRFRCCLLLCNVYAVLNSVTQE